MSGGRERERERRVGFSISLAGPLVTVRSAKIVRTSSRVESSRVESRLLGTHNFQFFAFPELLNPPDPLALPRFLPSLRVLAVVLRLARFADSRIRRTRRRRVISAIFRRSLFPSPSRYIALPACAFESRPLEREELRNSEQRRRGTTTILRCSCAIMRAGGLRSSDTREDYARLRTCRAFARAAGGIVNPFLTREALSRRTRNAFVRRNCQSCRARDPRSSSITGRDNEYVTSSRIPSAVGTDGTDDVVSVMRNVVAECSL